MGQLGKVKIKFYNSWWNEECKDIVQNKIKPYKN